MNNSLMKELIKEFNARYELEITSFMELDKIDSKLSNADKKYEALKNFVKNRYDNEQFTNSFNKVDREEVKKMLTGE